ncbi:TPA: ead/Ea22-like family protein [Klebsiella oxytoca]|nr:ead/Ea22-like family protein [Klebsiella oxytoca]
MTDITELAQSLKASAENAIGAHERLAAYPYGEIIDISQHEGEQIDIDITDLNEFNKEANPVNILALVEALEKAQQHIARQEQILLNQDESLSIRRGELEKAQDTINEMDNRIRKQNRHVCELFDDNTALRQRIAELEPIHAAAEKLVRCKGRYHSEQNYRALADLFGVTMPDLPPLDGESRTVKLPDFRHEHFNSDWGEHDAEAYQVALREALVAAGIKWEAE